MKNYRASVTYVEFTDHDLVELPWSEPTLGDAEADDERFDIGSAGSTSFSIAFRAGSSETANANTITGNNVWTSSRLRSLEQGGSLMYFGRPAKIRRIIESGVNPYGYAYKIIDATYAVNSTVTAVITEGEEMGVLASR
ncbi:hypothetical protein [Noviherbaspirillum malthae]|uniref:hypothetical protein n=1 Tax=Noviherbaspirillum malthae TaxID=1260987 RepID=UPI001890577B|nr:hypothetical protein [Noviherbaspirillum malthae]